jgi:hypothetical protein
MEPRCLTIAAALAVTACVPGEAAATARTDAAGVGRVPGLYGGGALLRDFVHFVSLRVGRDGRSFDARATLVTSCAPRFGDGLTESIEVDDGSLAAGGRYRASTPFDDGVAPGVPGIGGLRAVGAADLTVQVRSGGTASGTARVRTVYSDPATGAEVSRCDTGVIPWVTRVPARGGERGRSRPRPGVLLGTTAQDAPFLMKVARRGRAIQRAGMTFTASCPSTNGLPLELVAQGVRISENGRFEETGSFERGFTLADGTAVREAYTWVLRGRFGGEGAAGSFRVSGVVRLASDDTKVGGCDTGRNPWRASRVPAERARLAVRLRAAVG